MKLRCLITLSLMSATPSTVMAQSSVDPEVAVTLVQPATARTPRAAVAATLAIAAAAPVPVVVDAQTATPPQPPSPPKAAIAVAPTAPPAPPAPPRPRGQMINVRVEVTLADTQGATKTLNMTIAEGESARNRTTAGMTEGGNRTDYWFNADAEPIVREGKVLLKLTAEARVRAGDKGAVTNPPSVIDLRQSQTLVMEDGKAVEIARAVDPTTDRAFTLSVKAVILR